MTSDREMIGIALDVGGEQHNVGIIGSLFESCVELLKLSLAKAQDNGMKKASLEELKNTTATLFCWGDELGVKRGDLDSALQDFEETRDLALSVLISLGEFLVHDLISIFSQSDRSSLLQTCQINEQIDKAKAITVDWEEALSEDPGDIEDILETFKAEVARLNVLGQILEDPVPIIVNSEEARTIGLIEDRHAHQYYADMISIRFPNAEESLTEILGRCNWVRYNRIQKQREENTQREPSPAGNDECKSRFPDSGIGTSLVTQSTVASGYAETVVSMRAQRSHRRLPPLPEEGRKGVPFVCGICNTTVNIRRTHTWKKHVFTDILAYVCIFDDCPSDRVFFEDLDAMTLHIGLQHGFADKWQSQECPLCLEQTGDSRKTVSFHFARHMEEIALGALPQMTTEDDDSDTSSLQEESISDRGSDDVKASNLVHWGPNIPHAVVSNPGLPFQFPIDGQEHYAPELAHTPPYLNSTGEIQPVLESSESEAETVVLDRRRTRSTTPHQQTDQDNIDEDVYLNKGVGTGYSAIEDHLRLGSSGSVMKEAEDVLPVASPQSELGFPLLEDLTDASKRVEKPEKQILSFADLNYASSSSDESLFGNNSLFGTDPSQLQEEQSTLTSAVAPSKIKLKKTRKKAMESYLKSQKKTIERAEENLDQGEYQALSQSAKSSSAYPIPKRRDSDKEERLPRMPINPRDTDDPFPYAGATPSSPLSSTGGRGLSPSSTGRAIIAPLFPSELGFQNSPPSAFQMPQGSFKCEHPNCTAAPFQTQYLLNSHVNVHTQSRPHYCPVPGCPRAEGGKGFKRKNEMIRHNLVHASPGYVCPFCPDREHKYPRPDNLQRHVRVHHTDKDKDDAELREVLRQKPEGGSRGRRRRVD